MMEPELLEFSSAAAFETWLEVHGETSPTVGLVIAKKGSGRTTVTYGEAVESALCFGWIDGGKRKGDDETWVQWFSRRKPRSIWSQVNREKTDALTAAGRMRPSGLAAIEAAKRSGAWDAAYQPIRSREVPPELAQALAANPRAQAFFETLDSQNRFAVVFRSVNAKKEETRRSRIAKLVEMLERGEVIYPKK